MDSEKINLKMRHIVWTKEGWWVRFYRGSNKIMGTKTKSILEFSKIFSVFKYGTRKKALIAAKKCRDEFTQNRERREGAHDYLKRKYLKNPKSNNTSGIVGVKLRIDPARGGKVLGRWVASWSETRGNVRRPFEKTFSFTSMEDFDIAKEKAAKHRKQMVKIHCTEGVNNES